MKVMVTGASGFIGSFISNHLGQVAIVSKITCITQSEEFFSNNSKIHNLKVDLTKMAELNTKLTEDFDLIIHCAVKKDVQDLEFEVASRQKYVDNIVMTENICKYMITKKIPKIIYISSTNLFQKFDNPISEDSKVSPGSSYLYSKYASEIIIQKYAHNKFKYNTLRISAPFGNRMRNPTVILKFIDLAKSNKNIQIFNNRYQTFTHIDVILNVVLKLLQKDVLSGTYNITGGESVDMIELAEIILRIIPSKSQIIIPLDINNDVKNNKIYSLDKIKNSGINFTEQRLEDSLRILIQQLELNK